MYYSVVSELTAETDSALTRQRSVGGLLYNQTRGMMFDLIRFLGYNPENSEEQSKLIDWVSSRLSQLDIDGWEYYSYRSKRGPEFYFAKEREKEPFSFNIHHHGFHDQVMILTDRLPDPEAPMDGLIKAKTNSGETIFFEGTRAGGEDQPEWRENMPMVFKPPNYHWYDRLKLPARARVQLAAFPLKVELFPRGYRFPVADKEHEGLLRYYASPVGIHLLSQNMYHPILEFGGVIMEVISYNNEFSNRLMHLATVQTLGLTMDVLIPDSATDFAPAPGMSVSATSWISGRIKEVFPAEPNDADPSWVFLMQTRIAGTMYHDLGEKSIALGFWDYVELRREPENPYDARAVALLTVEGEKLGYIPRDRNQEIAALLDRGEQMHGRLIYKFLKYPSQEYIIRVYTRNSIRLGR